MPIREAQIIQESLDLVRVLVVPAPGFQAVHQDGLVSALNARLGNMEVRIERVPEIPRSANGKFRAVVSKVHNSVKTTMSSNA
jgi:phenylacetate-CoA ligase